ncbi:MAG: hypothetical protein LBO08_02700 [Rickettsiales bacterium]|nr:hypothetical protein [Rickettsiales bacterium]
MHKTIAIIPLFLLVLPAFADAALPIVNVSAAGVSARSAFGVAPTPRPAAPAQRAVARTATTLKTAPIVQTDVLSPRRPSDNIWAKNDAPAAPRVAAVAARPFPLPEIDMLGEEELEVAQIREQTFAMDAQLEKLAKLQGRADASAAMPAETKRAISSFDAPRKTAAVAARTAPELDNQIAVRREIIGMDDNDYIEMATPRTTARTAARDENEFAKLSPAELKRAFHKTYISGNKHLSAYAIADDFNTASTVSRSAAGFDSTADLSEMGAGIRPLEIKLGFRGGDSSLSRDNYNLLSEYAGIVVNNPKRAIQISIPENSTRSFDDRKLAAKRLAIVEQVLHDGGVADGRIVPVLSERTDDSFVLRVISSDQFESITQSKRDMFGDKISGKTQKSMTW